MQTNQSSTNESSIREISVSKDQMYDTLYDHELVIFEAIFDILDTDKIIDTVSRSPLLPTNMDEFIRLVDFNPLDMLEDLEVEATNIYSLHNNQETSVSTGWTEIHLNGTQGETEPGLDYSRTHTTAGHYEGDVTIAGTETEYYDLNITNIVDIFYQGGILKHISATLSVSGFRGDYSYLSQTMFRVARLNETYAEYPEINIGPLDRVVSFAIGIPLPILALGMLSIVMIVVIGVKYPSNR